MDNKLIEYLVNQCQENGELCTDSNIIHKLLIMDDETLMKTLKKLYKEE